MDGNGLQIDQVDRFWVDRQIGTRVLLNLSVGVQYEIPVDVDTVEVGTYRTCDCIKYLNCIYNSRQQVVSTPLNQQVD